MESSRDQTRSLQLVEWLKEYTTCLARMSSNASTTTKNREEKDLPDLLNL
jgi:hypothetical protein